MSSIDKHTLPIHDRDMVFPWDGSETLGLEYGKVTGFNIEDQHLVSAFADHTLLTEHIATTKCINLAHESHR